MAAFCPFMENEGTRVTRRPVGKSAGFLYLSVNRIVIFYRHVEEISAALAIPLQLVFID
jgi:hypothetical protein